MMTFEPARDHFRMDITAQTQLQSQPTGMLPNLRLHTLTGVNHMSNTLWFPLPQHHQQLLVRPASLRLRKVQRNAHPRTPAPGFLERGLQRLDPGARRVSAEVDADDAVVLELGGELHDLHCFGERVAAVDGQDEFCAEPVIGRLELGYGGEDRGHVVCFGKAGLGQCSGCCAQLEVNHAIGGEVPQDGEGGVLYG